MKKVEMKKKMQELKADNQNAFIDRLNDMVENLANKVNRVDYKMTEYEIQVFFNIVNKIKYIDETWRK